MTEPAPSTARSDESPTSVPVHTWPPPTAAAPSPLPEPPPARRARWWWIAGAVALGSLPAVGVGAARATFDEQAGVEIGDCVADVPTVVTDDLPTVPCSEPHLAEVFALVRDAAGADDPYPGTATMWRRAVQRCVEELPGYTGMPVTRSGLEPFMLWPSETTWELADDRLTICLLRAPEGDLVGTRRGEPPDEPLPTERALFALIPGDCFRSAELAAGGPAAAVVLVDCAVPHDFEVVALSDAPDDVDFGEVDRFGERTCENAFESYVGLSYERSVLLLYWLTPTAESWHGAEDRRTICLVTEDPGGLVGTVRNSER